MGDMRLLLAALLLTGVLGCRSALPVAAGVPADGAPAASAPFYLEAYLEGATATPAVRVINGFTGQVEAVIAAPPGAGSFPWVGRTTWYPCGAAPDDRTFLLCGTHQYWELRLGDDGKPQSMTGPADIPVAARNTGNGDPEFAVSADRRLAAVATATGIMVVSLVTGTTRSWTIPSADGYAAGCPGPGIVIWRSSSGRSPATGPRAACGCWTPSQRPRRR